MASFRAASFLLIVHDVLRVTLPIPTQQLDHARPLSYILTGMSRAALPVLQFWCRTCVDVMILQGWDRQLREVQSPSAGVHGLRGWAPVLWRGPFAFQNHSCQEFPKQPPTMTNCEQLFRFCGGCVLPVSSAGSLSACCKPLSPHGSLPLEFIVLSPPPLGCPRYSKCAFLHVDVLF